MVTIAELHYTVTLYRPTLTVNNEGGRERSYVAEDPIKGSVKRINQARVLEAGGDALIDTDKIVIRYTKDRDEITKEWEVEYMNKRATIVDINFTGLYNRQWIELIVKDKTSGTGI
jgi:SPP1 family predicted phage head-tail adaptor